MRHIVLAICIAAGMTACLFLGYHWRGRQAVSDAEQAAEAQRLREAALVVAAQATEADLRAQVDALAGANSDLAAELARAHAVAPDARPVLVVSARTEPRAVQATATPSYQANSQATLASCPEAPACVLAAGDAISAAVDEVLLQSEAGNRVLVGTVTVLRFDGAQLYRAPFSAPITQASTEPVERPRWGFGPWVAYSGDWFVGLAVAAPPFRVLGVELAPMLGGGLGRDGRAAASLGVVLR